MLGDAMASFTRIISRAIATDVRDRFLSFLDRHEVLEFGVTRKLTLAEAAMVLNCVDQFLVSGRFHSLGIAEITNLRRRLALIAQGDEEELNNVLRCRNACFDALACIAALEARLIMISAQRPTPMLSQLQAENDNQALHR